MGERATTGALVEIGATEMEAGEFVGLGLGMTAFVSVKATLGAGFVMALGAELEGACAIGLAMGAVLVGATLGTNPSCISNWRSTVRTDSASAGSG